MTRVEKLISEGKFFLVVSETEPYFSTVYEMIRKQELEQGTWTKADEKIFKAVLGQTT
jgi:hypothetical protein